MSVPGGLHELVERFDRDRASYRSGTYNGAHQRMAGARIVRERKVIGYQIEATGRQIDRLVYELYGLTDEEIGIIEGAKAR